MRGLTVSVGVTGIKAGGDFTDDLLGQSNELQNEVIPVPHAYVVYGINDQWAAGLGFFVPYGLGTEWEDTFEGRFNGYNNDLKSLYFQPTVAYQPHEMVKIGAGFTFVVGSVKLTQRLDLSEQVADPATGTTFGQLGIPFHTDFGNAQLKAGGAIGFGGNVGITVEPADWISFGARYMTRVTLDYDGDVDFEPVATGITLAPFSPLAPTSPDPLPLDVVLASQNLFAAGGPVGDQGGDASITMPDQLVGGVAVEVAPSLRLLIDVQWINWAVFDTLVLDFENAITPDRTIVEDYSPTLGIRVGFDWATNEALAIRGGYLYHDGAAPDETVTPLLP
jgi:long-chain fatty acid transport protein